MICHVVSTVQLVARDLGVVLDSHLTVAAQASAVYRSAFFNFGICVLFSDHCQPMLLRLWSGLLFQLIWSGLYCNSLLFRQVIRVRRMTI